MRNRFLSLVLVIGALTACVLIPTLSVKGLTSTTTLVAFGSAGWAYYRGPAEPPDSWATSPESWKTGRAPLGYDEHDGKVRTELATDSPCQPRASYFQKPFVLSEVPQSGVALTTWADDGVAVYVNGHEVVRQNLPNGKTSNSTAATRPVDSAAARSSPVHATIPASLLHRGSNLLAAEVHSSRGASDDVSFDARLEKANFTMGASLAFADRHPPAPPRDDESAPDFVPGWGTPTWQDEFTYKDPRTGRPAIDSCNWNVRDRDDLGLLFDAAVPSRDEVSVDESGVAHLRADWLDSPVERPSGQKGPKELWHKTAYLDQRVLKDGDASYSQRYGRWEIRAKVPTGPQTLGALAAFWLRNSESGEIDIMEAWGYNERPAPGGQRIDTATTTVHTQAAAGGDEKYIWHHVDYGASTPVWDDFHTYAFELTPDYAAIYVDGVRLVKVTPLTHPNLWNEEYFGSPFHVRLNLHVGPSKKYWGLPDPAHRDWTKPLDFQVDYVRMWAYHDSTSSARGE